MNLVVTKIVSGLAEGADKLNKKWTEYNTCNSQESTEAFVKKNAETIHHILHCHVCRALMVNSVNAIAKRKAIEAKAEALEFKAEELKEAVAGAE